MTQFLLATDENLHLPPGYDAQPLSADWQTEAASILPSNVRVVMITPVGSSMGVIVDRARHQVQQGQSIAETELGVLLSQLASGARFALFWANDFHDLPRAANLDELWKIMQPQLLEPIGNWELYALFG